MPNRTFIAGISALLVFGSAGLRAQSPAPPVQPGILRDTMSAEALSVSRKFQVRVVQMFGIRGIVGSAIGASIGQGTNTPGEWGQGWGAFGTRYASGFGNNLSRQSFAFTLETILHEDPRYFPSTEKTTGARVKSVVMQILFGKTDDGRTTVAYGRLISAFAAAQLTNAWQPKSNGGVGNGITRGFIVLSGDAASNFMQELIPFMRSEPFRHRH
jgi:hypothetical protein